LLQIIYKMKISLVIPSTPNHFKYLDCILTKYFENTVKPDQVIISVSEGNLINQQLTDQLKIKYSKMFDDFIMVLNDKKVMEGPNRGVGSKYATCDYITYHDSDDIPHPQRIEIIKHFFEKYDILHLNHSYTFKTEFNYISIDDIVKYESEFLYKNHFNDIENIGKRPTEIFPNPKDKSYGCSWLIGFPICGGPTSINRKVLDRINWSEDKILSYDYDFCMDVLFKFKKSMVINSPLIWYNKTGDISWTCN